MITGQLTARKEITGADVLLRAAVGRGVSVCFAQLAIDEAQQNGCVSTLVVPADFQQRTVPEPPGDGPARHAPRRGVDTDAVERVARELRAAGSGAIFILGGSGLSRDAQHAAGRVAAATGAVLYSETNRTGVRERCRLSPDPAPR
jgi:acetolactate synthase I/II/III large subunit